jgi:hypothetical protein
MLKGNDKLLDLNLNNNIRSSKARKILYEALYELFFLILQSPIENILFEIVTFLLSYLQIIMFIFNETVRQLIIKF